MRPQAFQAGEVRDEHDNIIRQGAYGKKTPFATADNSGILDYIINNFDVLDKGIKAAGIGSDEDGNPTVSPVVSAALEAVKLSAANAKKSMDAAIGAEKNVKASESKVVASSNEAKTAASQANASATEAGHAMTTATQQATKATTEANRAKTEADRAAESVASLDISNLAKLNADNLFVKKNTFNASVESGISTNNGSTASNSDVVKIDVASATSLTINPTTIFKLTSGNVVKCCVLLITGAGAPTITWNGCKLCCDAPAKTANKATIVTCFVDNSSVYVVSSVREV